MTQRRWVRTAAVIAGMLTSTGATAQPPPKPGAASAPDPAVAQVTKHFTAGRAAAAAKEWQKAADEFRKGYAVKPVPQLLAELGRAEVELGQHRDAAEHLTRFLIEDKGAPRTDREVAQGLLAQAKKQVVTLKITIREPGVEVLIDDQLIGVSPLPPEVFVNPGKHTVLARSGTARDEVTDTYQADWTRVITLKPKEPVKVAPTTTPTTTPTATPGAGETSGPRRELVIGGAALAGVAVVAGAIFAGLSASKAGDAADVRASLADGACLGTGTSSDCSKLTSLVSEQNGLISGSVWSFVGAGVLGAATVSYWFLAPRSTVTGTQPLRAGATVSGSGGKLVFEGSW